MQRTCPLARIAAVLILGFVGSLGTGAGALGQDVRENRRRAHEHWEHGRKQMDKGDYKAARASFLSAASLDPADPGYRINVGLTYQPALSEKS